MSEFPKKAKHITELPVSWIKKGEQYRLHTNSKGNNLPVIYISENIKKILEEFGAGYRKVRMAKGYMYEFWDKNLYITQKLNLPIYEFESEEYKFKGYGTFENPTKETIERAFELENEIKKYLESKKQQVQVYEGEMTEILKDILEGKPAKYVFSKSFEEDDEYETEDEHLYVFVLKTFTEKLTGHVLIFDRNKIEEIQEVKVPAEYIRYISGREGCNLKKMCKKMGIKKIRLKRS